MMNKLALEFDDDEIRYGLWLKYPRVVDATTKARVLDLSGGDWSFVEGEVNDAPGAGEPRVRLVVSHTQSYARFTLTMNDAGAWSLDGEELAGHDVHTALATKNVSALRTRAKALLAKRPKVPELVAFALEKGTPAAKIFYPEVGHDGAKETEDTALYWLLYAYDEALQKAAK